jgi:hypothetical protein
VLRLDALERLGGRSQAQPLAGGELDDKRAPLYSRDAADAELWIVAMREMVPGFPRGRQWAVSPCSITLAQIGLAIAPQAASGRGTSDTASGRRRS